MRISNVSSIRVAVSVAIGAICFLWPPGPDAIRNSMDAKLIKEGCGIGPIHTNTVMVPVVLASVSGVHVSVFSEPVLVSLW